MNGFAVDGLMGTAATWTAAVVTVLVWSYLIGARQIMRLAQYLLAGLATGYLVILGVREVLVPDLVEPLLDDPTGRPLLWVALALVALLAAGRWLPPALVAPPVAVLVSGTAAFALGGAVVGTVLPQMGAAVLPRVGPAGILNALISLIITVLVLFAFLHGTHRGRFGVGAAAAGRWLLLGGIGGWLGFLLVSRLAVLVDRVEFLLGGWLGVGR